MRPARDGSRPAAASPRGPAREGRQQEARGLHDTGEDGIFSLESSARSTSEQMAFVTQRRSPTWWPGSWAGATRARRDKRARQSRDGPHLSRRLDAAWARRSSGIDRAHDVRSVAFENLGLLVCRSCCTRRPPATRFGTMETGKDPHVRDMPRYRGDRQAEVRQRSSRSVRSCPRNCCARSRVQDPAGDRREDTLGSSRRLAPGRAGGRPFEANMSRKERFDGSPRDQAIPGTETSSATSATGILEAPRA